jgi:hypothetical protein
MTWVAPKQNSSELNTVPSPVGGFNAYDNLANMPATDAILLDNFVPQPYGCTIRKGYQQRSTGLGTAVNSLATVAYRSGGVSGFAWAGDKLFDVTAAGAVGAPLLSGLGSSWWQSLNFGNSSGIHMLAFDGVDNPILFNETGGIQRLVAGDGVVVNTVKNVNPATWIQGTVHQHRVWAVQVNTTLGWYLPTDSIYGTANFFDFGPLFKRGGYLVILATWTVDSGDGSNDKLVAVSSMGEAVVFSGTDVANAATWSLDGVYFVGAPVRGRRFYANVGGDLYLLTTIGLLSMATLVTSTQVNASSANTAYSQKVQFFLSELTSELGQLDGWEVRFVPSLNFLIINLPSLYAEGSGQLVSNYITTSWCTFSGYNANTFMVTADALFFGSPNGTVYQAYVTNRDGVKLDGTGGKDIIARCQQAYSYLGAPGAQKQIGLYRPNFMLARNVGFRSKISYDFTQEDPGSPTGAKDKSALALWNNAVWGKDKWSGGPFAKLEWRSAEGVGVAASLTLAISSASDTIWVSTDFTYIKGGPL